MGDNTYVLVRTLLWGRTWYLAYAEGEFIGLHNWCGIFGLILVQLDSVQVMPSKLIISVSLDDILFLSTTVKKGSFPLLVVLNSLRLAWVNLHIPDPVIEDRACEALVSLSHMVHNEPHPTPWPRVRERDLVVKAG